MNGSRRSWLIGMICALGSKPIATVSMNVSVMDAESVALALKANQRELMRKLSDSVRRGAAVIHHGERIIPENSPFRFLASMSQQPTSLGDPEV